MDKTGRFGVKMYVIITICAFLLLSVSDDSSSENGSANGLPALTPAGAAVVPGVVAVTTAEGALPYREVNGNGTVAAPLDFSTTSSSSSSEDQHPGNVTDRLLPPHSGGLTIEPYHAEPTRKYPVKTEYGNKVGTKHSFHAQMHIYDES